jgi:uncharacterized cofD-like protein
MPNILGIISSMRRRVKQAGEQSWHTHLQWLKPGLGVKRWLVFLALGVGLLSLGGTSALRVFYPLPEYFYYLTLQFLPRPIRVVFFLTLGFGSIGLAIWGLNRAMVKPFMAGLYGSLPEALYNYRRRGRGPKIVVIGGGHGQANVLRGLKQYTANLTAVVTVADDGGSSGRLRRELGILPPGDFRNCIAALADDESLITRLFQYRFAGGEDLSGHSFGNLFISAMVGITGSFESALTESSGVLAVQGQVLPCTLETVILCADVQKDDGTLVRVYGESEIPEARGQVLRVMLVPTAPRAYPATVRAILEADMVVIGPGSLYTSIMPNLLVPQVTQALQATQAPTVYICNTATQYGETDGYTAREHLLALEKHLGTDVISTAIMNTHFPQTQRAKGVQWVKPDLETERGLRVIMTDLVDETSSGEHQSNKLAQVIMGLLK